MDYAAKLRKRADEIASICIHAGEAPGDDGSLDPPIVMSSAFAFDSTDHAARAFRGEEQAWIYGRWGNPTVAALEVKLAALEGAEAACATASGMAAIAGAILATCEAGDHIVAPRSMYAESARLLRERLPKLGITTTFVDGNVEAYAAAITPRTKLLYLETPANPTLAIVDLAGVVALRKPGMKVLSDGTFATPFSQTPLAHGVDLVVHSMTKGLGGHGDVIAGVVMGSKSLIDAVRDTVIKGFGGILPPHSAWLVARGLRTFALRQERACATAAELATWLASRAEVSIVHHPSLASHPGHVLATQQMHAYGALLSFELRDGMERGKKVLESLKVATHAVSLGDVRTLVVHPASTTHSTMPREARELAGIGDGLIRVSCGIESVGDLIRDFQQSLVGY